MLIERKNFCEAESVITLYLKIVASLLHGGKHAVDKVEQKPWSNNNIRCAMIIVTSAIYSLKGEWKCSTRWQEWTKPKKVKKHWLKIRFVTTLGHQVVRRVFWQRPNFFKLCPIVLNYVQHIFTGGIKKLGGSSPALHPLVRCWLWYSCLLVLLSRCAFYYHSCET